MEQIGQALVRFREDGIPEYASIRYVDEDFTPVSIVRYGNDNFALYDLVKDIQETRGLMFWSSLIKHRDRTYSLVMVHIHYVVQLGEEFDRLFEKVK